MNPYAAPAANVADTPALPASEPVFFAVSKLKLALMSVVTFGLYEIYWFYKNWKCVQRNYKDNVSAPVRALFYPLVSYPLFKRIREHAAKSGIEGGVPAGALAIAVFALAMLWRLPDPWWVVSLFGFLPLLLVQSTVNEINRKLAPDADANSRFSGANIAALVIGGILLVLGVVGTFIPE
jgi:hypothetical protein